MKTYKKLVLMMLISFGIFSSCNEEFIERPLLVDLSAENFDPVTAVTACYNTMVNSVTEEYPNQRWKNWQTYIQGDAISDDAFKSGSNCDDQPGLYQLEQFIADPTNVQAGNFWESQYQHIYIFNWTLAGIAVNDAITEEQKNQYRAEVMFLRSLAYFWLNRAFGGVVPVFNLVSDEVIIKRATEEEIWIQLETDLKFAISTLPEKSVYPLSDLGRATKGAARALLAKVYMQQLKYDLALEQTTAIIQSDEYQLEADYSNLWKRGLPGADRNEHGVESVFEITFAPSTDTRNPSDWTTAQRGRQPELGGWGLINPTLDLLDEFETGDPRILSTFLFHGDTLPQRDSIGGSFGINALAMPCNMHMMLNNKILKSLDDYPELGANHGDNFIVIRYADILLLHAEAANEAGNTSEALQKLNMVRERARNSSRVDSKRIYINFNGLLTGNYEGPARSYIDYNWDEVNESQILSDVSITEKVQLRHAIWHERRVELALEGERFFDLTRQSKVEPNRVGNVMRAFSEKWDVPWKGSNFRDGVHEVFPIPGSEIDLVGLENLPQNNGY
jgi:starch-binding outer membrane protein, SusD/RagB family